VPEESRPKESERATKVTVGSLSIITPRVSPVARALPPKVRVWEQRLYGRGKLD
jgi:hypothetical protein